jgi:hypothetical protein
MSRKLLWLGAVLVAFLALPSLALADPPAPHQALSSYEGPETCAMCHPNAGKEVAESLHYQHQAPPKFLDGADPNEPVGMLVSF